MPISKPHSSLGASNKGSCSNLATYLQKENEEIDKMIKNSPTSDLSFELEGRKQSFFNAIDSNISTIDVIHSIDNNKRKLCANDAKYFAPTISFCENELDHITFSVTGKNDVKNIWDLNLDDFAKFNNLIREYGRKVMNNYALNFNRQDKGIRSDADLVYFGKIEHFRKFKGTDNEVIIGKEKSGTFKKGLQSHIHLIVSRKDKTQKLKLSPTCNETNTQRSIGNNNYQVGFDRVKWIQTNEETFDEYFKYNRPKFEKFENQNILKNGSPQEKYNLNQHLKAAENVSEIPIEIPIQIIKSEPNNVETETIPIQIEFKEAILEQKKELTINSEITKNENSNFKKTTIPEIEKLKKPRGLKI